MSEYTDSGLNLDYVARKAEAIAGLVKRRRGALYDPMLPTALTDCDATKARVIEDLRSAAARTRPQDTLVLFLAGHRAMVRQRYYFIPQRFPPPGRVDRRRRPGAKAARRHVHRDSRLGQSAEAGPDP